MILYRPINKAELDLIKNSGWVEFPSRLPEQPFFYPVLNLEYARQISIEWNLPAYGSSYIVQFEIDEEYIKKFDVKVVGNETHSELWIPAEELPEFNKKIIGKINLVETFQL